MTFTRFIHGLAPIVALVIAPCCGEKKDLLVEGITRELADHREGWITDILYSLHLDIPGDIDREIAGELTLSFKLSHQQDDLILDFSAPSDHVKEIKKQDEPIKYKVTAEHIVIPKEYLEDTNTFTFSFVAGEQALNRKEDFLYTLFVPARASSCFPVFDQPNLKAKYKLSLSFPAGWVAVSNSPEDSSSHKDDRKYVAFQETLPISSYLFAFAAGELEPVKSNVEGRTFTVYHRETDTAKVTRNMKEILDWHVRSLAWLEEYTGIAYPFDKFDVVLLPSFQFGGMEHPGAIFYKSSSLFLDESHTIDQELRRARLIAHETAHMWFGDLVTMDWFDDVWLKEVFANFMADKIVHPHYPQINHNLQFLMSHYPSAYAVDRTQGTHPIVQELDNLKDAGSLYGNIIYQKAPIVMRMLEENMGEAAFHRGIRKYLQAYRFSNATWDDLVGILAEETGYKLDLWNEQWVKQGGMPGIYYNLRQKGDTISKYVLYNFASDSDVPAWWPQAVEVALGLPDSTAKIGVNKEYRSVEVKEAVGLPFPGHVFNNAGGLGYGYFDMRKNSSDHYLQNIHKIEDVMTRAALWINLHECMVRGRVDPVRLLEAIITTLPIEREPLVISYITSILEDVFWIYIAGEQRTKYASKLEGVLLNNLLHAENDNLKVTYFDALKNLTYTKEGTDLLFAFYKDEMHIQGLYFSENDLISLWYELAVRDVPGVDTLIHQQLKTISNPDQKQKVQFVAKALSPLEAERDTFFESLKNEENRKNEEWVLEALHYLHHPVRSETSLKYIRPSLELLKTVKETGDIFFPKRWLDNTLGNHQSAEALDIVKQFLYKNNKYPRDLKSKILQSSDHLFRSVKVRQGWEKRRAEAEEKVQ